MVMSLVLCRVNGSLTLVTGYENGLAMVTQQSEHDNSSWDVSYRSQAHEQPVLSLDVSPRQDFFYTSSADANVVKHPIPPPQAGSTYSPASETPITSPPPPESHVPRRDASNSSKPPQKQPPSLLSVALAAAPRAAPIPQKQSVEVRTQPTKVVNTKHSGQQGLKVRSDGKIFATAGWDSKIRVYSAKTMHELAVLKWHQVGCYTIAFASLDRPPLPDKDEQQSTGLDSDNFASTKAVVPKLIDVTVKDRRIKQAKETHWLAAGSKDGKISLWDIY